jgi:single-strand DNA-binding protein
MTEASVSLAGDLTEDPRFAIPRPRAGSPGAVLRVAASGRREQEAWFYAVIVWRDQAEHAVESLSRGSRVVVLGRLQQRRLDRPGWQRPIHRRGAGRGAGAESSLGHGDTEQGGQAGLRDT